MLKQAMLAKNKSSKQTLLKHAYSTRLKSSKHAKMSAIITTIIITTTTILIIIKLKLIL